MTRSINPLSLTLLLCAPLWAQPTTSELGSRGPFAVEVKDFSWTDAARQQRRIDVRVYGPAGKPDQGPAIVFSPGLGGTQEGYAYFGEHMASHGFTTIHLNHPGSDHDAVFDSGGVLRAVYTAGTDTQVRIDRARDVTFALDQALRLRRSEPILARVDPRRLGVAGHSYGAWTALAMIGETIVDQGVTLGFRDRRIRCGLAMSPQGPGVLGLTADSWDQVRVPCHTMTGTLDTAIGTKDVAERRVAFDSMPAGNKYHLTIEGAEHSAFGDRFDRDRDPRHHGWILAAATAFFRAHLLGDAAARGWLERSELQRDTNGEVVQERK